MYYPLYNNPFYYPPRAYMPNMCSYNYVCENYNEIQNSSKTKDFSNINNERICTNESSENIFSANGNKNNLFAINGDRLEMFGISINIDDLLILVTLFFMFRENQIDYSIIIILALILFDQK